MTVMGKICRRMSPKGFALTAIGLTVVLCVYYTSYTSDVGKISNQTGDRLEVKSQRLIDKLGGARRVMEKKEFEVCPKLTAAETDVNTVDVFKDFEFQVSNVLAVEKKKKKWETRGA